MSNIVSQVSYPVFLYCVFMFFLLGSIFSFIVGVGLVLRNATILRFFDFMNKGYSVRKVIKPLTMPHFVEPMLFKRSRLLGSIMIVGAFTSIILLWGGDADIFQSMYSSLFSYFTAKILAEYTKSFLLIGNACSLVVGLLMSFDPCLLLKIEAYTDKWYTLRKQTRLLTQEHLEVDKWVMAHPTVFGVALSIMSLGLFASMYARI